MSRSVRSTTSRAQSFIDDIDAITPCTEGPPSIEEPSAVSTSSTNVEEDLHRQRSPSPASSDSSETSARTDASFHHDRRRDSLKAIEEGTGGDPERLWRRMLALQQIYGCYKSARMSAALSSGDSSLLLPSKACLDLLNDNISLLPDDVEQVFKQSRFSGRRLRKHRH